MRRFGCALILWLAPNSAWAQVNVDLSGAFNRDCIRNTGDTVDSAIDSTSFNMVTEGFTGGGFGLPDNGRFSASPNHPAIEIAGKDNNPGNNVIYLFGGQSATVNVPSGRYDRLQIYSVAADGMAAAFVTATYSDATTSTTSVRVPDWMDDSIPTNIFYVVNDMYRYSLMRGQIDRNRDAAVFGFDVNVDSTKTLATVRMESRATGNERWAIFGMTGERLGVFAADDAYAGVEDQVLAVSSANGVIGNDTLLFGGVGSVRVDVLPTFGSLQLGTDGGFEYTPNPNFFGADSFNYILTGSMGGTSSARVDLNIDGRNDPPTARDDAFGLLAPGVTSALDVLANDDALPDLGETLVVVEVTAPSSGGMTRGVGTEIEYTAPLGFQGVDTFQYTIEDGTPGSRATAMVSIQVGLPMGVSDSYELEEDRALAVPSREGVLVNDVAGDMGGLTAILLSEPVNGNLIFEPSGAFRYAPNADYFGTDRYSYEAENAAGGRSGPTEVTLSVRPVNDPPTARDDALEAVAGEETLIRVLENDDIAPDANETLQVVSVEAPSAGGTAVVAGDGQAVAYTPPVGFSGIETMIYRIDDGDPSSSASASVTATVSVSGGGDAGVSRSDAGFDAGAALHDAGRIDAGTALSDVGSGPGGEDNSSCRCSQPPRGSSIPWLPWVGLAFALCRFSTRRPPWDRCPRDRPGSC